MKILHYVDENRLSWAVPWLQLLGGLASAGLENVVVCRPGGTLGDLARSRGFKVRTFRPLVQSMPALCRGFGEIVDDVLPDLIHTRLSSAASIGGYWGKKAGIPVVATVDKYPKGKYYRDVSFLFACSMAVARHMRQEGFLEQQVAVVHNPVETSLYRMDTEVRTSLRREKGVAQGERVVLGAGRLVDWKGFDLLVRAFCRAGVPASSLWIVGDGPEERKIRAEMEKAGGKASLFPFAKDIRPYLWAADLFVQPSTEPEGFSLMLLEAMSAGLPVVATEIGGTTDILRNGVEGRSVRPGSEEELEAALREILRLSPEAFSTMGRRAGDRSVLFSISNVVEITVDIYKRLKFL